MGNEDGYHVPLDRCNEQESTELDDVHLKILEGETVRSPFPSFKQFHAARMALYRRHQALIDVGGSDLVLHASYQKGIGAFSLGEKKPSYSFQLLPPGSGESPDEQLAAI